MQPVRIENRLRYRRVFVVSLLTLLLVPQLGSGTQLPTLESTTSSLPSDPVRIPFRLTQSNNMVIQATLNESDKLTLMFHTAEDSIALTKKSVEKMKTLKISDSIEVESWGGKTDSEISLGNLLQIGDLQWRNQTIFIDELSGPESDGKFGPQLFQGKVLEINFDRSELVLHSSLPSFVKEPQSKFQPTTMFQRESTYLSGTLENANEKWPHEFMIHSGFGGTLLLDDKFVHEHDLGSQLQVLSTRTLRDSFGNAIHTKKVQIQSLSLGEFRLEDVPVEIFEGNLGRQKVSVFGGDLLRRFNWIFDTQQQHLYLAPSSLFDQPFQG